MSNQLAIQQTEHISVTVRETFFFPYYLFNRHVYMTNLFDTAL